MSPAEKVENALTLIASVPGFEAVARDLRHTRIVIDSHLEDRGQASLGGVIRLGPEPFAGDPQTAMVSVAGTLVHEHCHTRQNPLLKTLSFWRGVAARQHPMRRYEWPAYRRQAAFFDALARSIPSLGSVAARERAATLQTFRAVYGEPPAP